VRRKPSGWLLNCWTRYVFVDVREPVSTSCERHAAEPFLLVVGHSR